MHVQVQPRSLLLVGSMDPFVKEKQCTSLSTQELNLHSCAYQKRNAHLTVHLWMVVLCTLTSTFTSSILLLEQERVVSQ